MTTLLVSDDGVTLREDAIFQYLATCFFPDCPRDVDQAAYIMFVEKKHAEKVGAAAYTDGQVSRKLQDAILKKYARVSLAGTVAIVMCHHEAQGKRMSLNSAANIVSEFAYRLGKATISLPNLDGTWQERRMAAPADLADVKKIFREFQSVAHMLAALVALPDDVAGTHIFQCPTREVSRILQTAAHFQQHLMKYEGSKRWKLVEVASVLPECVRGHPPYLPSADLIAGIFGTK